MGQGIDGHVPTVHLRLSSSRVAIPGFSMGSRQCLLPWQVKLLHPEPFQVAFSPVAGRTFGEKFTMPRPLMLVFVCDATPNVVEWMR